jgi:trehalose synthase
MSLLAKYEPVVGQDVVRHLGQLAAKLRGAKVLHVNSTRQGGGVAEILEKLIPLQCELGMDAQWEIIEGSADFYRCAKSFHNALQGQPVGVGTTRSRRLC